MDILFNQNVRGNFGEGSAVPESLGREVAKVSESLRGEGVRGSRKIEEHCSKGFFRFRK